MATPDFIKAPVALFTNFFLPHPLAPTVSLHGKTILVTGATPGSIGYESAKTMAQWGAKLVVTVRAEDSRNLLEAQLEKDGIRGVDIFLMNLGDSESVSKFCQAFITHYQQLDVLLNNAGIYLDMLGKWKEERLSDDGMELHWRINFLGMVQLTNALFPLLNKTAAQKAEARVVMVSSHMHDNCCNEELFSGLKPYKSVKAYGRSKLALMHFAKYMHKKWQGESNIKFVCVHPGSIQTNLVEKGLSDSPLLIKLRNQFSWLEKLILLSPVEGAQTQIMCCSAGAIDSGKYYRRCKQDECSDELNDFSVSEKLWVNTEQWLKENQQPVHL